MLKSRVLTALVIAPLIIAGILFLSPDGFALAWGAVVLLAAFEWSDLTGLKGLPARFGFVAALLALMIASRLFALAWLDGGGVLPAWFYWPVVAWWALWAVAFRRVPEKLQGIRYPLYAKLLAGLLVLFSGWIMLVFLHFNFREYQVLYLVLLISFADIAAYFTGKRWGKTKLVEAVSPGKTVEGVYGALLAAAALALPVGLYFGLKELELLDFVVLSLVTVAFSVSGDLFESLAKRVRGVKDSGALLPGHGGMLDRIDSLLAGVSIFYVGSLLIPIFLFAAGSDTPIIIQSDSPPAMEAPDEHGAPAPQPQPEESPE
jgi:phosphatidate cytidylyltransferase